MKRTLLLIVCLALLMSGLAFSQNSPQPTNAGATQPPSDVATQLQEMKTMLLQQQQQIETLKQQLAAQQQSAKPEIHAPSLGQVTSTTPVLPPQPKSIDVALPSPAPQQSAASGPQASDSINLAQGKIKLGATVYGDWALYPTTGFGPQFLTQIFPPGPGNDNYNGFELSRSYVNFLFTPNDHLTIRVTPNLYREVGTPGTNGNLNLRVKYAYAELNNIFGGAAKAGNIRLGQQMNPLVDWEEALYGYRFVSLTPWNFLSLSSTQPGVSINGPIKGSNGKQYLDYQVGVFNNASFHAIENSSGKQFMARLSFFPMGATSRFQGLGLTGFFDVGTSNTLPSTPGNKTYGQYRISALAHYETEKNTAQIAFEYDRGKNAMSSGNLFSTGTRPAGALVDFNNLAIFALDQPYTQDTTQQGYDAFGHINLGTSKLALFGMYQFFQPNTALANNPLDFSHVVAGLAYTVNKNLRFAFDNQDILWRNGAAAYTAAQASRYVGTITNYNNVVGKDIKAFFINMELAF